MIFTKTEIAVLELLTSKILERFSIREVSRIINKDLKIVHTSIVLLEKKGFIIMGKDGIRVNYKANIQDLSYIENLKKEKFLMKFPLIKSYIQDLIRKSKNKFFTLIVFGSYASGKQSKKSDIDLLVILPEQKEEFENDFNSIFKISSEKFHLNLIDQESFREMQKKREEPNIVNETLNNHLILYGAEEYYSLLGERDVR